MGRDKHVPKDVFAMVIKAYLDSTKFQSLGKETQRGYRRYLVLAEHPNALGAIPVDVLGPPQVQEFLDGLDDTPGAQKFARTALQALEKWAVVRAKLPRQITLGTEIVGSDGGHVPWTDEEVALAEGGATAPHLARVVSLAANTGQRGSDLVLMRWTDIETVRGRPGINVTPVKLQGRLKLWVPFTRELIAKMETWERQPGPILRKHDGQPYGGRDQLTDAWYRERHRPGLEALHHLHLHGLRGTAVVRLKRLGATVSEISALVGMSAHMVERYTRLSEQRENALAAIERLDAQVIDIRREKK